MSGDAADPLPVLRLDALYRSEFAGLKRMAFLIVGSEQVAEDVVHDAFIASASHLDRLDSPAIYLRRVVVNGCRRHLRRQGRSVPFQRDTHVAAVSPDAVAVRAALESMSPRRRTAVVLRYFCDLSHDDIAAMLDCRPATARSLVRRGLQDLREVFDET